MSDFSAEYCTIARWSQWSILTVSGLIYFTFLHTPHGTADRCILWVWTVLNVNCNFTGAQEAVILDTCRQYCRGEQKTHIWPSDQIRLNSFTAWKEFCFRPRSANLILWIKNKHSILWLLLMWVQTSAPILSLLVLLFPASSYFTDHSHHASVRPVCRIFSYIKSKWWCNIIH